MEQKKLHQMILDYLKNSPEYQEWKGEDDQLSEKDWIFLMEDFISKYIL